MSDGKLSEQSCFSDTFGTLHDYGRNTAIEILVYGFQYVLSRDLRLPKLWETTTDDSQIDDL